MDHGVCVYTPEHGDRVSLLCSHLQVKFQARGARAPVISLAQRSQITGPPVALE